MTVHACRWLWPKVIALAMALSLHTVLVGVLWLKSVTTPPERLSIDTFEIVTLAEPTVVNIPQPLVLEPEEPPTAPAEPPTAPAEPPSESEPVAPSRPSIPTVSPKPRSRPVVQSVSKAGASLKKTAKPRTAPTVTARSDVATRPTFDAAYLKNPRPRYPVQARRRGLQGLVRLLVKVGVGGHPISVTVKHSSGYALLDRAARRAVKKWRFIPARRAGRAVIATVDVPIRFLLKNR